MIYLYFMFEYHLYEPKICNRIALRRSELNDSNYFNKKGFSVLSTFQELVDCYKQNIAFPLFEIKGIQHTLILSKQERKIIFDLYNQYKDLL